MNCFGKAGLLASPDEYRCDGDVTADDDIECLEDKFRQLSALPSAIPDGATVSDFVSAADDVQAVSDRTDAEIVADEANPSSDDDADDASTQPCTTAELASAFSLIRRCCGPTEGGGLAYVKSLNNIEDGLMNITAQTKKQARLTDFFRAKKSAMNFVFFL